MSRLKGSLNACTGMTDKEVAYAVAVQYDQFCKYRYEIPNGMPDRRIGLFDDRSFDGRYFEAQ